MRLTLGSIALAVAALGPCEIVPTTFPVEPPYEATEDDRCAHLAPRAIELTEQWGFTLDCTPVDPRPGPYMGQYDAPRRTLWVWSETLSDETVIAIMWHELGHLDAARAAVTNTEERAWIFSWCNAPQDGLGYPIDPFPPDCGGMVR